MISFELAQVSLSHFDSRVFRGDFWRNLRIFARITGSFANSFLNKLSLDLRSSTRLVDNGTHLQLFQIFRDVDGHLGKNRVDVLDDEHSEDIFRVEHLFWVLDHFFTVLSVDLVVVYGKSLNEYFRAACAMYVSVKIYYDIHMLPRPHKSLIRKYLILPKPHHRIIRRLRHKRSRTPQPHLFSHPRFKQVKSYHSLLSHIYQLERSSILIARVGSYEERLCVFSSIRFEV